MIVDDYLAIEACRRAVDDFRQDNGSTMIFEVDWTCVYWRRSCPHRLHPRRCSEGVLGPTIV